jgi:endonuclease G
MREASTVDSGFDVQFLPGHDVEPPKPATDEVRADLRETAGQATVRDCTHFSLAMSETRRLCRWVAWNIDGAGHRTTTVRSFKLDPEYPPEAQIDGRLYADNPLDQGHIAAFADVSWGAADEAARAREQSCYFTNITPQLDSFNRSNLKGVWGEVEAAIARENDVEEERISVFGGPILRADDVPFDDVLVPRDFWKVLAYVEDAVLRAKAYILTQRDLEGELEDVQAFMLEEYKIYQHRVDELASELGLDLGRLTEADTAPVQEGLMAGRGPILRRVTGVSEINAPGW